MRTEIDLLNQRLARLEKSRRITNVMVDIWIGFALLLMLAWIGLIAYCCVWLVTSI